MIFIPPTGRSSEEMPYSTPVPPQLLRVFKDAGKGLSNRQAGERIIQAALNHFRAEITVLDRDGTGELFELGSASKPGRQITAREAILLPVSTHANVSDGCARPYVLRGCF